MVGRTVLLGIASDRRPGQTGCTAQAGFRRCGRKRQEAARLVVGRPINLGMHAARHPPPVERLSEGFSFSVAPEASVVDNDGYRRLCRGSAEGVCFCQRLALSGVRLTSAVSSVKKNGITRSRSFCAPVIWSHAASVFAGSFCSELKGSFVRLTPDRWTSNIRS